MVLGLLLDTVLSHMDTFTIVQDIPDEVVTRALHLWDDKVSSVPKFLPVLRIRRYSFDTDPDPAF
jgi:hypothetical protein